ncbi:MAG: hypothetical protein RIA38_03770 [Microcella pacifica]
MAEQLFEVVSELGDVEQASAGLGVDDEVDVAVGCRGATCNGSGDANAIEVGRLGKPQDETSLAANLFECGGGCIGGRRPVRRVGQDDRLRLAV